MFAQLGEAGRAEQVEQRLTDAIILGVLAPGDRLPSEAELSKRFGVAVVTAREALGSLREAGLVRTKRGRDGGSFVMEARDSHRGLLRDRLRRMPQVELGDLGVYFGVIATGCAERAAEFSSPEDAARLQAWLLDADFASEGAARRNAGGFYLELAVRSQSPRLVREQIRLQAEFGPLLWLCMGESGMRELTAATNRAVASMVSQRDAVAARSLVRHHVDGLVQWLLAAKARLEDEASQGATPQPVRSSDNMPGAGQLVGGQPERAPRTAARKGIHHD